MHSDRCPRSRSFALLVLLAGVSLFHASAPAAMQTWPGDGGSGGNGTWSTSADWNPNTWVAGNIALFGGTAGTESKMGVHLRAAAGRQQGRGGCPSRPICFWKA